jgi:hypothetical protein
MTPYRPVWAGCDGVATVAARVVLSGAREFSARSLVKFSSRLISATEYYVIITEKGHSRK